MEAIVVLAIIIFLLYEGRREALSAALPDDRSVVRSSMKPIEGVAASPVKSASAASLSPQKHRVVSSRRGAAEARPSQEPDEAGELISTQFTEPIDRTIAPDERSTCPSPIKA
jgi:hypothetical protein